jgi:hypothetical protein
MRLQVSSILFLIINSHIFALLLPQLQLQLSLHSNHIINSNISIKLPPRQSPTFKMYTKNIIAAAFAGLAAAAPTARSTSDTLGLIATHSGNSNVHLRTINENGLKFWIGKDTSTYCPTQEGLTCPSKLSSSQHPPNYTNNILDGTFTEVITSADSETLSMNVVVPGGQQAYVAEDGSLSVTQAHSVSTGTNGLRAPFSYTPQPGPNRVGGLSFNGNGFVACPAAGETGVYQIFAAGSPGYTPAVECIGVGLATAIVESSPVWQYI